MASAETADTISISRAEYERLQALDARLQQALATVEQLKRSNVKLSDELAAMIKRLYGRSSERIDPDQLALFEGALAAAERQAQQGAAPKATKPPKPNAGHGRPHFPEHLPREVVELDVPESERCCADCGEAMVVFGEEITERGHMIPAQMIVMRYVRKKYACPQGHGVKTPPLPSTLVDKGKYEPSVYANLAVAKYGDHLPLHRLSGIYKRYGFKLAKSTMWDQLERTDAIVAQPILAPAGGGRPVFRAARSTRHADLARVLATVCARVEALLCRRDRDAEEALRELAGESPTLAAAQAASVQGRLAFGPRRGQRVTRVGSWRGARFEQEPREDCAVEQGFSLHAGPPVSGADRERLERLCRYAGRPAIATERLHALPDGRVAYDLRHTWSDGTTRVVFEPLTLIEKLAALVPPPRAHLVTYHGVLAPAAAWRAAIVPGTSTSRRPRRGCGREADPAAPPVRRRYAWAELLRRVFAVDVLRCGECGGRRRLIATIMRPSAVRGILDALGLPSDAPRVHSARGPPGMFSGAADSMPVGD